MKLNVIFFVRDGVPLAEYINPLNGKPHYFLASLVIKKIMPGNQHYKVKIKGDRVVKVIKQLNFKLRSKKKHLKRALKQMKGFEI